MVWQQAQRYGLWVILERYGLDEAPEIATRPGETVLSSGRPADRLFLSADRPSPDMLIPNALEPAVWGWLVITVPRVRGHALLLADIAAKSDYFDLAAETVRENPLSLRLFGMVVPPFRKLLRRPVWARNILDVPPRWHAYRDIGYTDGAAAWELAGGELCQDGVANIRFSTHAPDTA